MNKNYITNIYTYISEYIHDLMYIFKIKMCTPIKFG
jgi:hypothetical protein